jgi:hypothetical protein
MQRTNPVVITGWRAVILSPLLLPFALLASLLLGKKTVDRSADDVAGFLRDFIEGTGGEWDWDEFESVPITDPELEGIRLRATTPGARLEEVLRSAESIVRERAAS